MVSIIVGCSGKLLVRSQKWPSRREMLYKKLIHGTVHVKKEWEESCCGLDFMQQSLLLFRASKALTLWTFTSALSACPVCLLQSLANFGWMHNSATIRLYTLSSRILGFLLFMQLHFRTYTMTWCSLTQWRQKEHAWGRSQIYMIIEVQNHYV